MKKLFTLLILAVLMCTPRTMHAEIVWQTATGNEWRINPNNPGDPNDSIRLAPGTKFFYLRAGRHPKTGDRLFVTMYKPEKEEYWRATRNFAIDDFNVFNNYDSDNSVNLYENFYSLPFTYTRNMLGISKPRPRCVRTTADRLIIRFLGYDYVPSLNLNNLKDKYGNPITVRKAYDYLRKLIMTEEEVLALKKLDLSPLSYGFELRMPNSREESYEWHPDLSIFRNLEELNLTNMTFDSKYNRLFLSASRGVFAHIVAAFPKLKRLAMDYLHVWDNAFDFAYGYEINLSALKDLEYLSIGANEQADLYLHDMPNLKEVVINSKSSVAMATIYISNCPKLTKIDASDDYVFSLNCSEGNGNVEELYIKGFQGLECQNNKLKTLHVESPYNGTFTVDCSNNLLESLTLGPGCAALGTLDCHNNNLTSLELPANPRIYRTVKNAEPNSYTIDLYDEELGQEGTTIWFWDNYRNCWNYRTYIYYWDLDESYETQGTGEPPFDYTIREDQVLAGGGNTLWFLDCSNNSGLTTLSLPDAYNLGALYCYSCNLSELDVTPYTNLRRLRISHNKISSLDLSNNKKLVDLYCNNNRLTSLDCSGLEYLEELKASQNRLTELDMSNCSALTTLYCDAQGGYNGRLLRKLDLTGCTSLDTLHCQNNALLSLNLSDCPGLSASNVQGYTQRGVEDVTVLDQDKVCIELPNGVTTGLAQTYNSLFDLESDNLYVTWENSGFEKERNRIVQKDDKTYLVIHDISDDARGGAQAKRDVDFYGKKLRYQYVLQANNFQETLGGSAAHGKKNDNITVTVYPYVMYINPATEDLFTTPAAPFYSGTIYLDYDAVVPEGTEVYIATGMQLDKTDMLTGGENTTSGQLNLVKLTLADGATHVVIPALTPVYVKSPDETGLFSFARNLDNEPLATVPAGNIFKGTLTDKTVEPLSVLTLSKGRKTTESGYTSESRVGFWRYSKSTVPAHRVYIEAEELEKFGGGSARGMTFNFFDSEAEMLTAIEGLNAGSQQQPTLNNAGWYTPSGLRLNDQPTEKGVYIRNGKKVVKH